MNEKQKELLENPFSIPTLEDIASLKGSEEEKRDIQEELMFQRWRWSPKAFVREGMGINTHTEIDLQPTKQQDAASDIIAKLAMSKIKVNIGCDLDELETELVNKIGMSISSGHNCGKDAWISWMLVWFLNFFSRPKILCTAPTDDQIKKILWSEVIKWQNYRNSKGEYCNTIRDWYTVQNDKIFCNRYGGKEAFAIPRTASIAKNAEEQAETIAGFNEKNKLVIIDEASGVPDPVFKPLEGGLGGECNIAVKIFNPTKNRGYAHQNHFGKDRRYWHCTRWDGEECEIVTKKYIENMEKKYGRSHNMFLIRVKGLPPKNDVMSAIPLDWVYNCVGLEFEPDENYHAVMGVDCSYMGKSEAVLCIRKGPVIYELQAQTKIDTHELTAWALSAVKQYEVRNVYIDVVGVGCGVYDNIKEVFRSSDQKVVAVNAQATADNKDEFYRIRDEMWWRLRTRIEEKTLSIPDDDDLIYQISAPRLGHIKGKKKIESKEDMKARNVESPDRADALCLTFFRKDEIFNKKGLNYRRNYQISQRNPVSRRRKHSYMGA